MGKGPPRIVRSSAAEPLIRTNPAAAAARLRRRHGDVMLLDPDAHDDPRFEALERNIQSDVRDVFGENSHEDDSYWSLRIYHSDEPEYLDDGYNQSQLRAARREGVKRTLVVLESLIRRVDERLEEQQAQNGNQGGPMSSPLTQLAKEMITLVKPDGATHVTKSVVDSAKYQILVADRRFPVEAGDTIERVLPHGGKQVYDVVDPGWIEAEELSHYAISVRLRGTSTAASPPVPIVNHYHVQQAAAVGHGATAVDNTLVQHVTNQTLNVGDPKLSEELASLRAALKADPDDDADLEIGHVVAAQKGLKEGDESVVRTELAKFGRKSWEVIQATGLTLLQKYLEHRYGAAI